MTADGLNAEKSAIKRGSQERVNKVPQLLSLCDGEGEQVRKSKSSERSFDSRRVRVVAPGVVIL